MIFYILFLSIRNNFNFVGKKINIFEFFVDGAGWSDLDSHHISYTYCIIALLQNAYYGNVYRSCQSH